MLPHLKSQEGDWGRGVGREEADGWVGGVGLTAGAQMCQARPKRGAGGLQGEGSASCFLPITAAHNPYKSSRPL